METDDLIEQILQESSKEKLDYDKAKYSVDDLLKEINISEPKKKEDNTQSDLLNTPMDFDMNKKDLYTNELLDNNLDLNTATYSDNDFSEKRRKKSMKIEEKLELPKYENPLDLVKFIELESSNKKVDEFKNSFNLKNYKESSKLKINSLEIDPQIDLSREIFRRKELLLSAICAKNDMVITGNTIGEAKVYSINSKKQTKQLSTKDIRAQINCFDFTDDGQYLFIGFDNGNITMWEIEKEKLKLTISEVHYKSVIALKVFKREGKFFHLLSSDVEGNVFLSIIKDGTFKFRTSEYSNFYTKNKDPTFLIKMCDFSDEEVSAYPFLELAKNFVIMSTLTNVQLYTVKDKPTIFFELPKPSFVKELNVPDVSIGIGKTPDSSDNKLLFSIAWGKVIFIYLINTNQDTLSPPEELGYFINTATIYRMGFLTNSLIYFFDSTKFIKVINTKLINLGAVKVNPEMNDPIVPEKNLEAQLDNGRLVDPEIKSQILFRDKQNNVKATYINYIIENRKCLHLLGQKTLYNGKLLNWESCLNSMKKDSEEEWLDLLTTGIDIYQSRMPALADIPQDENQRKLIVGNYLRGVISQYVLFNTGSKRPGTIFSEDLDENEKMGKCISNTIEFCIEIESVDYLLKTIEPIFDSKEYGELFLSKLEPFILCDKILKFKLTEEIITKIIDLYKRKKMLDLLSQLLLHLNIESINNEKIKTKIEEMNLITPLMYICMNGDKEDYFTPISKLFDQYLKALESNFTDYYSYYEMNNNITDLKNQKRYIGHKLMWYVLWCLRGKKFPFEDKEIEVTKYKKLISKITYWLLTQKVFLEFVRFDAKNYFYILSQVFSNSKLIKMLEESAENNDEKISALATLYNEENKLDDIEPSSLINYLVNQSKLIIPPRGEITLLLNEFVTSASKIISLPKDLSRKTAESIFISYQNEFLSQNEYTKNKTDDEIINLSDDLVNLIDDKFEEEDYKELLEKCIKTPFDTMKLFLYKKLDNLDKCLEIFLEKDAKIRNKTKTIFRWINSTLMTMKDKPLKKPAFLSLKKCIMDNVCKLGKLSIEQLVPLVETWFHKDKKNILNLLESDPEVQLKYIEILVKKVKENIKENESNFDEEEPGTISNLLKLHIKLLCEQNRKKEIVDALKSISLYPLDECLPIVNQYKVYDAAIYLYQQTGATKEALDLSMTIFEETFKKILNGLLKEDAEFSENIHTLNLNDLKVNLANCIDVCEHNKDQNEDLWFTLLDKLYELFGDLNNNPMYKKKANFYNEVEKVVSNEIKDLLEKMCSFVSIKRIIDKVTDKFKNAAFKEFKELLLKMLSSFSNLTKILESAKQLLCNYVIFSEYEFIKLNGQGNTVLINECSCCKKPFIKNSKSKERIIVFTCGHISHEGCVVEEEGEKVCKICRQNEIESSIDTSKYKMNSQNENENIAKNKYEESSKDDSKISKFNRLKAFDKRAHEKTKMLIENSVNTLRLEMTAKF